MMRHALANFKNSLQLRVVVFSHDLEWSEQLRCKQLSLPV